MESKQASDAEKAEAQGRLKGFCKPANQWKDNFDPARVHRAMYGNEPGPRTISRAEFSRLLRS